MLGSRNGMDSKFRYVIVASKRAKQLLKGAKPKIRSRSKNLIRVAQEEVKKGLVDFEIIKPQVEPRDEKEDMFLADELFGAENVAGESIEEKEVEKEETKKEEKSKKLKVEEEAENIEEGVENDTEGNQEKDQSEKSLENNKEN